MPNNLIELSSKINNQEISGIFDTGSEKNFISSTSVNKTEFISEAIPPLKMICANGSEAKIEKRAKICFSLAEEKGKFE